MTWRAPSIETLADSFPYVEIRRLEAIRDAWKAQPGAAAIAAAIRAGFRDAAACRLAAIDSILKTHGVDLLGRRDSDGALIHYCNAGDTYATTLIATGRTLRVGCWGDYLDPRPRRGVSFFNAHSGEFGRVRA